MANALLDFVMTLVRDHDAAARYAADPAQALADAGLAGVTSADVQNLIPVVTESMSMAAPVHALDAVISDPVDNVWASGAATAAFDAFDVPDEGLPQRVVVDVGDAPPDTVDLLDVPTPLQVDDPAIDDPVDMTVGPSDALEPWAQPVTDADAGDLAPGFDLFD
ncbi:IniB N-terminal domain-containing protein [Mycobacterium sp. NAZ190054]|uniref:Rv0340 family IniB-related protein n=1 Tax=Mycobacterium sp. NAZ190054 TaxID=1747766 RepID=UPI0007936496|nr:IniB N-terminal domain-containing protein [Mycobacterium sp. NAZ190054]KWX66251.1 hypothetical protein ASJ79_26105 [Mycobacterium sp. NAZ190054]